MDVQWRNVKCSSHLELQLFMLALFTSSFQQVVFQVNAHLRQALKRGVATNSLKQVKGTGASGSFRLAEHKAAEGKVKKARKPKAKKASGEKKPAAKKAAKPKSPKKVTRCLVILHSANSVFFC